MIWLYVILAIILFFSLLLLSNLYIKIDYSHTQDDDQLSIMVKLWFFRYTFKIPLVKIDKDTNSIVFKKESQMGNSSEVKEKQPTEVTPNEILNGFKNAREVIQHVVHLHSIVRAFLQKVTILKLDWHTNFGIGDAALTGMLVGAGWAVKGGIIGLVSQYMRLKTNPTITITPFFQHSFSHTKLTCMLSFRIGNAILAGLRIVKFWKGGLPSFTGGPSFLKSKNSKSIS
ncbi:DUF2953 domain-containing protein [Bacillus pinisoli]|uniref:DUF2953 domain-containing protein n=1 Tax=Bacillus pinisoli TaxID=2901866 RepID=UPI001FF2F2A1|nr:DUF2953 domain-containing protein [Bacillus pinisoli]